MDLPSMVQRSGDTLIVRSVVSGNQLYMDQSNSMGTVAINSGTTSLNALPNGPNTLSNALLLEQQFACIKKAAEEAQAQQMLQQQQQHEKQQQQQQQQQHKTLQQSALNFEIKDEALPQCKIKRNYSCNYCTYFTQNPRYHLTHLRDVHGEKIVINKCQLCLYASRHYQKLVRHMRMVHGCTDGAANSNTQNRGKRSIVNRDTRKRKIDQTINNVSGTRGPLTIADITSLEQVKCNLERQQQKLQRDIEAFNKQQEEQKQQHKQQINAAEAILVAAYEQQLKVQQEFQRESRKVFEQHETSPSDTVDAAAQCIMPQAKLLHLHSSNAQQSQQISLPPPQPQRPSFELTPSPSGSASSPSPTNRARSGNTTPNNVSTDEPSNNRLLKCTLCDYTTLYRSQLDDHEKQDHSNTKLYHCLKCQYVTHLKARFSKHVKYHSMPMIKCVTCDFRTPYKWNLDRHMKNHGGAGPFKCAACDFTADIKQSLTVHEMNHHVPPVGHAAGMTLARRRNKVGGTDLNDDFFADSTDMLDDHYNNNNSDDYDEMLLSAGHNLEAYHKRIRHEEDEPTDLSQKGGSSDTSSVHNQSLVSVTNAKDTGDSILNLSKDLAVSRSSLTEIASMFFNEKQISELLQPLDKCDAVVTTSQLSPTTTIHSNTSSRNIFLRKSGNFFDKLKSSSTTNENLVCPCGHLAKCLSESIIHRKSCTYSDVMDLDDDEDHEDDVEGRLEIDFADDDDIEKQSHSALNLSMTGSTRCQYCRHRCKSSVDLLNHLRSCVEANSSNCNNDSFDSSGESTTTGGRPGHSVSDVTGEHPMENRVFIWNKLPLNTEHDDHSSSHHLSERKLRTEQRVSGGSHSILSVNNEENSYYGVETAPGYGEVTKKMTPEEEAANSSLKKVYKCPHCSFWASTASRFHVHIVGHLNKKPFECSLCSYRSNWRWDITKHIRLKTIRDPSHKNARVLMNDETGRRNYTKYNKYITLMKVTEEDGDPKLMKSGEMTPNQVASLSFINDYNKQQDKSSTISTVNQLLNGMREDITLEPLSTKSNIRSHEDESGNYIRIPLLASMMNTAAMAQQQQYQQKDQDTTTLITPSVTISAVKKSPSRSHTLKSNEDSIIQEFCHENGERKTYYKCRKCNFRNLNRDIVWTHMKNHTDFNTSLTNTSATSKSLISNLQAGIKEIPVNSNLYMNKVLAAMYLGQQEMNSPNNSHCYNILKDNIGQVEDSPLNNLGFALNEKCSIKTLKDGSNILEHSEQKSNTIERHCRLKHAGDIRIETLDRLANSSIGTDRSKAVYRPLHDMNHGHQNTNQQYMALKALQQQNNNTNNCNNNGNSGNMNNGNSTITGNNNPNKLLNSLSKVDATTQAILNSPLTLSAAAAANSSNTPQDLQAAAVAYLAAAYKAATTNPTTIAGLPHLANSLSMAEEVLLQQQLQQNDQIEIIRVSSASNDNHCNSTVTISNSNTNNNKNQTNNTNNTSSNITTSNLAQLLESTQQQQQQLHLNSLLNTNNNCNSNNNKSKQQKCPLCTYICDSKSQMNYHISLHKPTQYECPLCTFVCAKKQHLSSHMRTVHQITQQQHQQSALINNTTNKNNLTVNTNAAAATAAAATNSNNNNNNNNNNSLHMDFTIALQLAAAKIQVQDSPLAIDLTNLSPRFDIGFSTAPVNVTSLSKQQQSLKESQLPPEYQYRMIYYCSKCPARYAQKHNDPLSAKFNLEEHMRAHASETTTISSDITSQKYRCEYCDFTAPHETLIQAHRFVHTTQYQEKCNNLFRNCKEDIIYHAPKLMQITTTKKSNVQDTIWIVDNELNHREDLNNNNNTINYQQQQIVASNCKEPNVTTAGTAFEGGNSLLKKQLESRQAPSINSHIVKLHPPADVEDSSSNTHSTSASIATSDLAGDNESNINSPDDTNNHHTLDNKDNSNNTTNERCEYCPYESDNMNEFKAHLQHHISISQKRLTYTCEHCDYTAIEQEHIDKHTQVHFNSVEKLKQVTFFTSYDKLELSMEQDNTSESGIDETPIKSPTDMIVNGNYLSIKKELQINQNITDDNNIVDNKQISNKNNETNDDETIRKNTFSVNTKESRVLDMEQQQQQTNKQLKCNKIILYKSDGGLSIKKEPSISPTPSTSPLLSPNRNQSPTLTKISNANTNTSQSQLNDNISDRLRRKITNHNSHSDEQHQQYQQQNKHQQQQQSISHKTILVNAKTGQVISRK